jgi:2-dehydro-3-deoxyphosphogluconate aldolase / (4S)-4-hydroxy-2-oxoglutarate aldolase
MEFQEFLSGFGVIPVVEIPRAQDAVPLAAALAGAGLPCAEITFRTASAAGAIAAIASAVPGFSVGAGTVLNVAQAETAVAAGAQFLVAPGFDPAVVAWAKEREVPILPGVCTPSEVMRALAHGVSLLKFFPAEAMGGVPYLKAIAAPFKDVRFVPTGGISAGNLAAYLAVRQVVACGGSWMVKKDHIAAGDFDTIGDLAREAVAIAASARLATTGG